MNSHVDLNADVKALLLQVGINKQSAGTYGPIFDDGLFEYIPAPAENKQEGDITYNRKLGTKRLPLSIYLPSELKNAPLGKTPDFKTPSFCSGAPLSEHLSELEKGDLLVFYAGLQPFHTDEYRIGLYVIGYLTVKDIVISAHIPEAEAQKCVGQSDGTVHIGLGHSHEITLVIGEPTRSRLLDKAVPFAELNADLSNRVASVFSICAEMSDMLGISGLIADNAAPKWILGRERVAGLEQRLRED